MSYEEGFEELDLFWSWQAWWALIYFVFLSYRFLPDSVFFYGTFCYLLWAVGIISVAFMLFHYQQMIYLLSDPFHSCLLVVLLVWGPEAVSWFVCWSNFSKLKLWFIIIVSCKPVTQHIQDWLSKRIEKRNYLLEKLWDDDLVHVTLWKRWGACH